MQGTTKQVAWATDIKTDRFAELEKLEALPIPADHPAAKALATVRERYTSDDADQAAWWITLDQIALRTEQLANQVALGKEVRWPQDTNMGWE